jgi:hypothetical protein
MSKSKPLRRRPMSRPRLADEAETVPACSVFGKATRFQSLIERVIQTTQARLEIGLPKMARDAK